MDKNQCAKCANVKSCMNDKKKECYGFEEKSISQKLHEDYYQSKLLWVSYKDKDKESEAWKARHDDEMRLDKEFHEDLYKDLGIENNPKKEKLFSIAWEMGHSGGLSEVYGYALDLVELIN